VGERRTSNGMVPCVVWTDVTVAVAVETCHGVLAEDTEGFLEYCFRTLESIYRMIRMNKRGWS
jgi:hypothetical protein